MWRNTVLLKNSVIYGSPFKWGWVKKRSLEWPVLLHFIPRLNQWLHTDPSRRNTRSRWWSIYAGNKYAHCQLSAAPKSLVSFSMGSTGRAVHSLFSFFLLRHKRNAVALSKLSEHLSAARTKGYCEAEPDDPWEKQRVLRLWSFSLNIPTCCTFPYCSN